MGFPSESLCSIERNDAIVDFSKVQAAIHLSATALASKPGTHLTWLRFVDGFRGVGLGAHFMSFLLFVRLLYIPISKQETCSFAAEAQQGTST